MNRCTQFHCDVTKYTRRPEALFIMTRGKDISNKQHGRLCIIRQCSVHLIPRSGVVPEKIDPCHKPNTSKCNSHPPILLISYPFQYYPLSAFLAEKKIRNVRLCTLLLYTCSNLFSQQTVCSKVNHSLKSSNNQESFLSGNFLVNFCVSLKRNLSKYLKNVGLLR